MRVHHEHDGASQARCFRIPHYVTGARFAVRANSDIAALADFRKRKLVSTTDTSPLKAARAANSQYLIGAEIGEVPDHAVGLDWVDAGKADGFVMDEVLLAGLIASRPDPVQAEDRRQIPHDRGAGHHAAP